MADGDARPSAALPPLARARLDELLEEVLGRVGQVLDTQERLRVLLDAVVGIAGDLDLDSVLQRIVRVSCQLANARYGALGVLGSGHHGVAEAVFLRGYTPDVTLIAAPLPSCGMT